MRFLGRERDHRNRHFEAMQVHLPIEINYAYLEPSWCVSHNVRKTAIEFGCLFADGLTSELGNIEGKIALERHGCWQKLCRPCFSYTGTRVPPSIGSIGKVFTLLAPLKIQADVLLQL